MPETPRTWTLRASFQHKWFVVAPWPKAEPMFDEVEVIEKAPVDAERERMLGLLESLEALLSSSIDLADGDDCNVDATRDLLFGYGRLPKEER